MASLAECRAEQKGGDAYKHAYFFNSAAQIVLCTFYGKYLRVQFKNNAELGQNWNDKGATGQLARWNVTLDGEQDGFHVVKLQNTKTDRYLRIFDDGESMDVDGDGGKWSRFKVQPTSDNSVKFESCEFEGKFVAVRPKCKVAVSAGDEFTEFSAWSNRKNQPLKVYKRPKDDYSDDEGYGEAEAGPSAREFGQLQQQVKQGLDAFEQGCDIVERGLDAFEQGRDVVEQGLDVMNAVRSRFGKKAEPEADAASDSESKSEEPAPKEKESSKKKKKKKKSASESKQPEKQKKPSSTKSTSNKKTSSKKPYPTKPSSSASYSSKSSAKSTPQRKPFSASSASQRKTYSTKPTNRKSPMSKKSTPKRTGGGIRGKRGRKR